MKHKKIAKAILGSLLLAGLVISAAFIPSSHISAAIDPSATADLPDMTIGAQGASVSALQEFLNKEGSSLPVTGYFGPRTQEAVRQFQIKNGINPTGYFGPLTNAKLKTKIKEHVENEAGTVWVGSSDSSIVEISGPDGGVFSTADFERDLNLGSSGQGVSDLQKFLVQSGHLSIPFGVSYGYFGPATQRALQQFQLKNGIVPATGSFGPLTRAAIKRMLSQAGVVVKPGIVIASPVENAIVSAPLRVAGVVSGDKWPCVDGQVGTAAILDQSGVQLATAALKTNRDCTASTLPFEAILNFQAPKTGTGMVLLKSQGTAIAAPQDQEVRIPVRLAATQTSMIVFTAPLGGERWFHGETHTVSWSGGAKKVTLALVRGQKQNDTPALENDVVIWTSGSIENTGSYALTVPATISGLARFKITDEAGALGYSNAVIFLPPTAAGDVTVTAPKGSDVWELGSAQTITWTGAIPPESTLSASCDDKIIAIKDVETGKKYLIDNLGPLNISQGKYVWKVGTIKNSLCANTNPVSDTILPAGKYQIELSWFDRTSGLLSRKSAQSEIFAIISRPQTLQVIAPTGGSQWQAGVSYEIKWRTPPLPDVMGYTVSIILIPPRPSCLDSVPACKIAELPPYTITTSAPNSGSYKWFIPADLPDRFITKDRIQVSLNQRSDISGTSDPFYIVKDASTAKSITVLAPNGGEVWPLSSTQTIRYAASQKITSVNIQLISSLDCTASGCAAPVRLYQIANSVPNTGSFEWVTGKTLGGADVPVGKYIMRIVDADPNSTTYGQSDAPFAITPVGLPVYLNQQFNLKVTQTALVQDFKKMSVTLGGIAIPRCLTCVKSASLSVSVPGEGSQNLDVNVGSAAPAFGALISVDRIDDNNDFAVITIKKQDVSQPAITVAYPNGGETFSTVAGNQNNTIGIRWTAANAPENSWVALFLINKELGIATFIAQRLTPASASYSWPIPGTVTPGTNYKIEARLYTGPNLCVSTTVCTNVAAPKLLASDASDAPFAIINTPGPVNNDITVNLGDTFKLTSDATAAIQSSGTTVAKLTYTDVCAPPRACIRAQKLIRFEVIGGQTVDQVEMVPGGSTIISGFLISFISASENIGVFRVARITTHPVVSITTQHSLQGITAGFFNAAFLASGGNAPYTITLSVGTIPPGLQGNMLIPSCAAPAPELGIKTVCPPIETYIISGVPTTPGRYPITLTAVDSLGNSGSANFTIVIESGINNTPPPNQQSDKKMIVPAYFYPTASSPWNQLTAAAGVEIAIMNPGSGPGGASDPSYASAVNKAKSSGVKVIGYVATTYGAKPIASVKSEIDKYFSWYAVDGIFIDEAEYRATETADIPYYQQIYSYIKSKNAAARVVTNPGTIPDERFVAGNIADMVVIFEGSYDQYKLWSAPAWVANYPPQKFGHLVYQTSRANVDAARSANSEGYVYITDDTLPNPWDTLPPYFSCMLTSCANAAAPASTQQLASMLDVATLLIRQLQQALGIQ